jgi:transcription regulator MmyB-like protein
VVAEAAMQRVLDEFTETPAVVLGRTMDIPAWNSLAAALITDFSRIPASQRNYVRLVFTDLAMRDLYHDWETIARMCVAFLRMEAAENPEDPRLATLVGELSMKDPQFRQWWAARHVASNRFGTKTLHHPVAGEINLDWDTFRLRRRPRPAPHCLDRGRHTIPPGSALPRLLGRGLPAGTRYCGLTLTQETRATS